MYSHARIHSAMGGMGRLQCEAAVVQLATEDGVTLCSHVYEVFICERGVVRATRCGRYVATVASGRFCEQVTVGQLETDFPQPY